MDIMLTACFILILTALLIFATHLRAKCREATKSFEINFAHGDQSWRVVLRKMRFGIILHTFAKAYPKSPLFFCPEIAYAIKASGKTRLKVPNFFATSTGLCLCPITKKAKPKMELAIVFKDLPMANAFINRLLITNYSELRTTQRHNKIIIEWNLN